MAGPLWRPTPERAVRAALTRFAAEVERPADDYKTLHRWSVEEPEAFWCAVWSFCDILADRQGDVVLRDGDRMPGARWFPDARLNFARNLLRRRDAAPALICHGEAGARRELSFGDLNDQVSRVASALRAAGIAPGDRVAGILPNTPEAVIAALAAASIGAPWSSCSPDFGVQGVLDRFGQIAPRVLFCVDGYDYGGKRFDTLERLPAIVAGLPSLERVVVVAGAGAVGRPDLAPIPYACTLDEFVADHPAGEIEFASLPFDHPLYILYSSGTTGRPKCIVHGAGGTLLQHLKEHRLHVDLGPGDRFFFFTTCGWMMWNWLVSGLASGATLVLYDGSPFHAPLTGREDPLRLFALAEREKVDVFGVSAVYLGALAKAGARPGRDCDLSSLRTLLSTGSPLLSEGYDYVYEHVKPDLHLASISGGTDIVSCFVGGNPTAPVWRGEIQAPGLGMKVEVFDTAGRRVVGQTGELVCTAPFPSMPVGFWRDPEAARYRAAYFERFPGVWCHGDWTAETAHGGYVITGRSDAVLNPGGVRIGTAEIYRQVERLGEVLESIAVGQEWDGDVRVVLFVVLREGVRLDDDLVSRIEATVRQSASPRHVPAVILQVPDIPRTRSGKITELAVRDVVHGRPVKNVGALANPEALEHFANRPELRSPQLS
ncbi:MAG: acetoacetate--CoA ligase [Proteobacteria bacterium]|nr:acetoacetate--CoA ligase [Pseudomonadota bacterium]